MMKRSLCYLFVAALVFFSSLKASAQTSQQRKNDSVFVLIKESFNAKDVDGLYELAGSDLKKELPPDKFRDIAVKQLFALGSIRSASAISFANNNLTTYKVQFETVTLQLLLTLDADNKMKLFLFQPYEVKNTSLKMEKVPTDNPLISNADKIVDSVARLYIQKSNTVGISVGILKNGKISTYGYGETARNNNIIPKADNLFEIGSITKTFTAALLAWYVNAGKVALTDPITKYLPDSLVKANADLKQITLQMLSNHTSGLASIPGNFEQAATDPLNPYQNYTLPLMYSYLEICKLNSKPGEKYAYSNFGVGLLGKILEKAGAKSYDQLVYELIAKPLGMKNTVQHLLAGQEKRMVQVYNAKGESTLAWGFDALAPCGALRSTVTDLLAYAKANMATGTGKLGKAFELTHKITFDNGVKMGLGWHVITVNNVEYYFHNGGTFGSSSFLAYNAAKGLAVVVLSNASESTDGIGVEMIKKLQ